jgi:two-component system sensor histidine kinase KdpD
MRARRFPKDWPAAVVWLLAWLAMALLDGHIDLANQALILVVAAALAALWLPALVSMIACAVAVLAFNFSFVPPRGTFTVDLQQHTVLLITMLAVSWLIALLMARQRKLAVDARIQFQRAEQLRTQRSVARCPDRPSARRYCSTHYWAWAEHLRSADAAGHAG